MTYAYDDTPVITSQPSLLELCFTLGVVMLATTIGLAMTLSAFVLQANILVATAAPVSHLAAQLALSSW